MARAASNMGGGDPNEWSGTRDVIIMENRCGYCNDGMCKKCAHEIAWFDKLWICGCTCNSGWKPVKVVVDKKAKTKVTK